MKNKYTGHALERGPVPLYHQAYLHLVDALAHGEWKRGSEMRRISSPAGSSTAIWFGPSRLT